MFLDSERDWNSAAGAGILLVDGCGRGGTVIPGWCGGCHRHRRGCLACHLRPKETGFHLRSLRQPRRGPGLHQRR